MVHNIIVFGETGAGKSSILNMLDGGEAASVGSSAQGVTFANQNYEKVIKEQQFKIFDTVGLNEGSKGTVTARDAITKIYQLMNDLETGVSLLVFVLRAPRITDMAEKNYKMFFQTFCKSKVRIVIVVTGLEQEENMDDWWTTNQHTFDNYEMKFAGHACVTASRGKKRKDTYLYQEEYEQSKVAIEKLILDHHSPEPWVMPPKSWFVSVIAMVLNALRGFFSLSPVAVARDLYDALMKYGGLTEEEANAQASAYRNSEVFR